jgi:hypothetical protein
MASRGGSNYFHSLEDFAIFLNNCLFRKPFSGGSGMAEAATLEKLLELAKQLSAIDKIRLIERLAPQIECELKSCNPAERKPLRGLWKGVDLSEEDIDRARRETWAKFPHEDI